MNIAPVSTPALGPSPADALIGKLAFKAYYNLGQSTTSREVSLVGLRGAADGYEGLTQAIEAARQIATEGLGIDKVTRTIQAAPSAVVKLSDRYFLMETSSQLFRVDAGRVLGVDSFKTFKDQAGPAVTAVIDGAGQLVKHNGTVGFWD